MAANTYPNPSAQPQPTIDNNDVKFWTDTAERALSDTKTWMEPTGPDAREFETAFFGCFDPIDTCLLTWCCQCVTFGRAHHRMHKDANLEGYHWLNASCLMSAVSGCFYLHWAPVFLQRADMRRKYNLNGNWVTDLAKACCCSCCDVIQQDKEITLREKELAEKGGAPSGYTTPQGMSYPSKEAPAQQPMPPYTEEPIKQG